MWFCGRISVKFSAQSYDLVLLVFMFSFSIDDLSLNIFVMLFFLLIPLAGLSFHMCSWEGSCVKPGHHISFADLSAFFFNFSNMMQNQDC